MAVEFTVPYARAHWALNAVLPAVDRKKPGALRAVLWEVNDGTLTLTGTDNIRVHEASVALPVAARGVHESFTMPLDQALWIFRTHHTPVREFQSQLLYVKADTRVLAEVRSTPDADHAVFAYERVPEPGKYPNTRRLFNDAKSRFLPAADHANINPDYLADLRGLRKRKEDPLRFYAPNDDRTPVLVRNRDNSARALVMPMTDQFFESVK